MAQHVTSQHLTRLACLYVRQSTLQHVLENTESTLVFGRTRSTKTPDGKIHTTDLPRSQWIVLVKNAHVGYITWEDYERNGRN